MITLLHAAGRRPWHSDPPERAAITVALLGVALGGCLDPTQITLTITTDIECTAADTTGIMVAELEALEEALPVTTTTACVDGRIGTLVAVPSGSNDAAVAFKVVRSLGVQLEECYGGDFGPNCIEARRALRYIPHTKLQLPIPLRSQCRGVSCPPGETCVDGVCHSAHIDPSQCAAELGCGEELLPRGETPPAVGWSKAFGNSAYHMGVDVGVDARGNVYVTGAFSGDIDLGGDVLSTSNRPDVFNASYDAAGNHQWSHRLDDTGDARPRALTVGDDGTVFVTGIFDATMSFPDRPPFLAGTLPDGFTVALDPDTGAVRWARHHASSEGHVEFTALRFHDGNLYAAGYFIIDVRFVDANNVTRTADDSADVLVACLSAEDGSALWADSAGGAGFQQASALAVEQLGNTVRLHVGGVYTTNMGATFGNDNLSHGGLQDGFYAVYDRSGTQGSWMAEGLTGSGETVISGIEVDDQGNPCLAGWFTEDVQFSWESLGGGPSPSAFATCRRPDPDSWSKPFANAPVQFLGAMVADQAGMLYVHGTSSSAFDLDSVHLSNSTPDVPFLFVAGLRADTGTCQWAETSTGTGTHEVWGLAHGPSDVFVATGRFDETLNFGYDDHTASGPWSAYLAQIIHAEP